MDLTGAARNCSASAASRCKARDALQNIQIAVRAAGQSTLEARRRCDSHPNMFETQRKGSTCEGRLARCR